MKPCNRGDPLRSPTALGRGPQGGQVSGERPLYHRVREISPGTTKLPQPMPTATGVERPAQRLLPAAAAGNFRQSFLPLLPGPPRDSEPASTSLGPEVTEAEMEVPAPGLSCGLLRALHGSSGLGGGCFASGHRPARLTRLTRLTR